MSFSISAPAPLQGCPSVPTDGPGCWDPERTACEAPGLVKDGAEPLSRAGCVPAAQAGLIWGRALPMFNEVLCTDVSTVCTHTSRALGVALSVCICLFTALGIWGCSPRRVKYPPRSEFVQPRIFICTGRCSQLSMPAGFALYRLWVVLGCPRCSFHCQRVLRGGWPRNGWISAEQGGLPHQGWETVGTSAAHDCSLSPRACGAQPGHYPASHGHGRGTGQPQS